MTQFEPNGVRRANGQSVRLGLIGCGDHAYQTLAGQLRWAPDNVLVAAADIRQDRLDRFAKFYRVDRLYLDYRQMLAEASLDAVIVSVGHEEHPAIAAEAMRAGSHVFVEKSPCMTERQAMELAALQEETGRWMMVGWQRRFMPANAIARDIAHSSEFGPIHMYQSQVNSHPYRRDEDYFLINHVIHHLDLARFFMGDITLSGVQRVAASPTMYGYTISFRAEKGGIGTIQSGAFLEKSHPMERTELIGEHRNLVIENFRYLQYNRPSAEPTGAKFELSDTGALVWDQRHRFDPRTTHRGFEDEIYYFVSCVSSGRKPSPDIADSAKTMRLLEDLSRRVAALRESASV